MPVKLCFAFLAFYFSLGCAVRPVQTEPLLTYHPGLPTKYLISNTPFVDQGTDSCGPASLTMLMLASGKQVSIDEISSVVYTQGSGGSYPVDLISASRRYGMTAIPINTLSALLTEVAANHPVAVFENVGLSWAPKWHFSVVIGYDLNSKEIIRHSGHTPYERTSFKFFERSWKLGNYWGLNVIPPTQLSITANEMAHATAAAGLEQAKKLTEAKLAYLAILQKWPNNLVALIGLGNISFQQQDPNSAITFFQLAVKKHPQSIAARTNLAIAQIKYDKKLP